MQNSEETKDNKTENNKVDNKKSPVDILGDGLEKIFNSDVDDTEVKDTEEKDVEIKDADNLDSEDSKDQEVKDDSKSAEADDEYEPIPQNQVDIARKLGYPDAEIIKMAEDTPERLERMVELYSHPKPVPQQEQKVVVPEKKKEVVKLEHTKIEDFGDLESDTVDTLKPFLKIHNKLIDTINEQRGQLDSLGERATEQDKRSQLTENQRIDKFFDSVSKDIPELGSSFSLTQEQASARTEVYGVSRILMRTRGLSEETALEEAAYLYGLSHVDLDKLEVDAEERLKEKLNKQKKKMSPRPGGKKSTEAPKHGRKAAIEFLTQGLKEIT